MDLLNNEPPLFPPLLFDVDILSLEVIEESLLWNLFFYLG